MTAPAPRRASCRWLIVTTVRDRPVHDNLLEACLVFGPRNLRLTKEETVSLFPQGGLLRSYIRFFTPKIRNHSSSIFFYLNIFIPIFDLSIYSYGTCSSPHCVCELLRSRNCFL